jgi:hypothetical protein
VVDLLREQPYTEIQSYLDDTEPKGDHYYWKTGYVAELSDELLSTLRELGAECPIQNLMVGMLHVGGALNERAGDDGVVGNRDARYVYGLIGRWDPGDARGAEFREWVRDAGQRLQPFGTGGNYINFQTADEGEAGVHAAYGDNLERLVEVKRSYDPHNLFCSNRNVGPSLARRPA